MHFYSSAKEKGFKVMKDLELTSISAQDFQKEAGQGNAAVELTDEALAGVFGGVSSPSPKAAPQPAGNLLSDPGSFANFVYQIASGGFS
jgi:hypothetical protein